MGQTRKDYSKKTLISQTSDLEKEAFETIQKTFDNPNFLYHQDPNRCLYIDLDASKRHSFGVMVYHMQDDHDGPLDHTVKGNRHKVQPILFLSKLLTDAETRYWPTELEIACLVWTVKKIRYMINGSLAGTVIWTDHSATVQIMKQMTLTSSSTDKLNLRLVQASQYCSQFCLDVRHRPGRLNVVPDALSRLLNRVADLKNRPLGDTLDEIHTYHTTVVGMSPEFQDKLKKAYLEDKRWTEMMNQLSTYPYFMDGDLVYYLDPVDARRRLCVPKSLEKDVFMMAHDEHHHAGFHRAYNSIVASLYIRNLSRRLKQYITHCPKCLYSRP